jgi:MFS family permease
MSQTMRHREIVLSLKYSTIEACFSVPMLNLTMPNLPFLLAYATAYLKWHSWAIGLIAALPHLCNCVQPPISRLLERRWSLNTIMRRGFAMSAAPWLFIGASAYLPGAWAHLAFALLLTAATLANSVTSVAWSAAIAQVVPGRISGAYFGRRNLIFGAWTLIAVLLAGKIVDAADNQRIAFGAIFAAAGLMRFAGLFFLQKMKFPPGVTQKREAAFALKDILKPLLDPNYRSYMLFIGLWGMFLNMSLPFYTVYVLRFLDFNVGQTIILATLATLGGILTLRSWGLLADRFGSKPVQYVCSYAWILVGLAGWTIAGPRIHAHLYLLYLVIGGATAGFQLAQFNLMLKLIPAGQGSLYIAVFLAATSALTALGPLLGGALIGILPRHLGTVFGEPVMSFHFLFILSFLGCLLSLPLLTAAHEPSAQEVHSVWNSMLRMRSFNPLLALTSSAGFLFTPRGILSLGRYSIRTLRREVKKVIGVGSEIVAGGQTLIKDRL